MKRILFSPMAVLAVTACGGRQKKAAQEAAAPEAAIYDISITKADESLTTMAGMMERMDPDFASKPDIKWNFTKFLIDREGNVIARYEPMAPLFQVEEKIKELL